MNSRPKTFQDTEKLRALLHGEIQPPSWIADWNVKIEECRRSFAGAMMQGAIAPELEERYATALVKMMSRKDRLYTIWLEGRAFKTWGQLAGETLPSRDDIFTYTVTDTEDYLNGPGVQAFAFFLETKWKGFFKDYAHACLRDCDPLLEEGLKLTPEVRHTLSYPQEAFGTDNPEVLESRLLEWADDKVPDTAPFYTHRLLIANMKVALGNVMGSFSEMEFARCEATDVDFPRLMQTSDPKIVTYLSQAQYWLIDVLLKLWPAKG